MKLFTPFTASVCVIVPNGVFYLSHATLWMDGWRDEWMDGWRDEWMDG